MNIAFFTDSFLPGVGGTEKAVLGLANALCESGNNVLVCCPKFGKFDDSVFKFKVARAKSIKITKNDCLAFPNITSSLKRSLDDFKPDVVHIQTVSPMASFGIKYAKKHSLPILTTVHTKFKTAFQHSIKIKFIVNILIKKLVKKLNNSNKVYTVSKDMVEELHSYGYGGGVTVIRNGAMFKRISNVETLKPLAINKFNLENEQNILLYVGHIVKFKNLEFTFNALTKVKQKIPNFKMLLVGSGADDNYFKNLAVKLGLDNNLIFTGVITNQELLSSVYSIADLYVFPSIFDNDPLTVVEASLHKVPAITIVNTGSSERIINEVSGFTTNLNEEEFANKIIELLNNKQKLKEVGINAEKQIPKEWSVTASEYLKEYETLIKQSK